VVTDPALARGIGFFNIYHLIWESIEQGKILMHCGNTTFIYHDEASKYMKVEGVTSEDIFDYLFNLGAENFLSEKEKKYVHELFEKGIQSTLKMMTDLKTILEMKAYRISRMTSLVTLKSCSSNHVKVCLYFSKIMQCTVAM